MVARSARREIALTPPALRRGRLSRTRRSARTETRAGRLPAVPANRGEKAEDDDELPDDRELQL